MPSNACIQCFQAPKDRKRRFCSSHCTNIAAFNAPNLLLIPHNNEMYHTVKSQFRNNWASGDTLPPRVKEIYMVTWSHESQDQFYQYRASVESHGQFTLKGMYDGNERKFFRGAARACTIGEDGNESICTMKSCKLCEALRLGFGPYLYEKQTKGIHGTRLGAGLYSTPNPAKALGYAENLIPSSTTNVIMLCRVVVGEAYETAREEQNLFQPPHGYDSVYGVAGPRHLSRFTSDECVVYRPDAIRPAYIIVF